MAVVFVSGIKKTTSRGFQASVGPLQRGRATMAWPWPGLLNQSMESTSATCSERHLLGLFPAQWQLLCGYGHCTIEGRGAIIAPAAVQSRMAKFSEPRGPSATSPLGDVEQCHAHNGITAHNCRRSLWPASRTHNGSSSYPLQG